MNKEAKIKDLERDLEKTKLELIKHLEIKLEKTKLELIKTKKHLKKYTPLHEQKQR